MEHIFKFKQNIVVFLKKNRKLLNSNRKLEYIYIYELEKNNNRKNNFLSNWSIYLI